MKRLAVILVAILLAARLFAQNDIRVEVPGVVEVDEQFNITFIIEGEKSPSSFSWSPGDEFQLVWGPQKGTSSSISIINGKKSSSFTTNYTYILMPRKAGSFTLPKASASIKGETIYSKEPRIEVVSGRQPSSSSQSGGGTRNQADNADRGAQAGDVPSSDLFLRMNVSRNSVVVGEPVTASLKIYQRANITGFEGVKFPSFDGFWSQEAAAPSNVEFHRESLHDMIYNVAELRSWVIIPQQSGTLTIDPAEIVCLVSVRTPSQSRSIFDSFFQEDYRTIRKRVTSDPVNIRVSALPAGAPASFGGGVGTFTMDAVLTRDSLDTHDAASLTVTVRGRGNVSLLESPKVSFPPDFEAYDVKVTERTDKSGGRTSGEKSFEYPFIPRSHGDFEIPSVEYTYFDINSRKYVTLSSGNIPIHVNRSRDEVWSRGEEDRMVQAPDRRDVKNIGSDIRFIATDTPNLAAGVGIMVFSGLFWIIVSVLVLLAAAICIVVKKAVARRSDVVLTRNRAAGKMARKRLARAKSYLDGQLCTAFYEELHRAVLGYVSDKLNMDPADMTKENIASSLESAGVETPVASAFTELLEACEFARYSPTSDKEAMTARYESAVDVISAIDSGMKHRKNMVKSGAVLMAVAVMILSPSVRAAENPSADSLWTAGCAAYAEGRWADASEAWESIFETGVVSSPELLTNLGSSYYKQGDVARAILFYEKALKADPGYRDAQYDLEFASQFVQDRIEEIPEFFLVSWVKSLKRSLSSNEWCMVFFCMFILLLACAGVFLLAGTVGMRKAAFFTGIVAAVMAVVCLSFSASLRKEVSREDRAVIMRPVSSVRSAPGTEGATDLFILHEGTRVRVLESVGVWKNIELSDGRQGWVPAADMEII